MFKQKLTRVVLVSIALSAFGMVSEQGALAAGKKKPASQPNSCTVPPPVVAMPLRVVFVTDVKSKEFPLPNGSRVDLSRELTVMLGTGASESGALAPVEPGSPVPSDPCSPYIEIHGDVTALEMNLYEYGLTIGYTPAGAHNVLTEIKGTANIKVGKLAMDFSLRKCLGGLCTALPSSHVDQSMIDANETISMDFGTITTAFDLAQHPSFNKILRKLIGKGIGNMIQSPRMSELPWTAIVREYDPSSGTLIFDAGQQSHILVNQKFAINAFIPAAGVCSVYKAVAYVHAVRVDPVSTFAMIDQQVDSRGVQAGDVVMITNQ